MVRKLQGILSSLFEVLRFFHLIEMEELVRLGRPISMFEFLIGYEHVNIPVFTLTCNGKSKPFGLLRQDS